MEVQMIITTADEQEVARLITCIIRGYLHPPKLRVTMENGAMVISDDSAELAQK